MEGLSSVPLMLICVYRPEPEHRSWRIGGIAQHRYEEALQAYGVAETTLGREPAESTEEWWREWIGIQLGRMWSYYLQNQVHGLTELAEKTRPVVEQYGR